MKRGASIKDAPLFCHIHPLAPSLLNIIRIDDFCGWKTIFAHIGWECEPKAWIVSYYDITTR